MVFFLVRTDSLLRRCPQTIGLCSRCRLARRLACLQESELTPSGANLLDGRYAVFGYVVEGQDLLTQLQVSILPPYQIQKKGKKAC